MFSGAAVGELVSAGAASTPPRAKSARVGDPGVGDGEELDMLDGIGADVTCVVTAVVAIVFYTPVKKVISA